MLSLSQEYSITYLDTQKKILPIFNPDENQPAEEHLKQFKMKVRLMNVRHEDVICRLFPFTFIGKAFAWYFSLPSGSIHNWNMFEEVFLKKYGDDKTPADLVMDLSHMKIGPNEKIKDFNQRFLTLRDKIPATLRPAEEVTIQFYTKTLPATIAMFMKRAKLTTPAEVFDETILIEKDRNSLIGNLQNDVDIASSSKKRVEPT